MKTIVMLCDILAGLTLIGVLLVALPAFMWGPLPGVLITGIGSCLVICLGAISQVCDAPFTVHFPTEPSRPRRQLHLKLDRNPFIQSVLEKLGVSYIHHSSHIMRRTSGKHPPHYMMQFSAPQTCPFRVAPDTADSVLHRVYYHSTEHIMQPMPLVTYPQTTYSVYFFWLRAIG